MKSVLQFGKKHQTSHQSSKSICTNIRHTKMAALKSTYQNQTAQPKVGTEMTQYISREQWKHE
jgi:hypothetical protein